MKGRGSWGREAEAVFFLVTAVSVATLSQHTYTHAREITKNFHHAALTF